MDKLLRKKGGHWESFDDIDGLGHECRCLLEDMDGNIWIGTHSGLSRYDGRGFVNFTTKDGLADNDIIRIYQDREGVFWIGTRSGLSRYDGKEFVNFTSENGLAGNEVLCIQQDKAGNIWIGTRKGLSQYDGEGFVNFTDRDGLAGNCIYCLYHDKKGNIWIGTNSGLSRYDGSQFVNFTEEDGLLGNIVLGVCQDEEENIWIGTLSGLSRYDGSRFTNFTEEDGLSNDNIQCIHKDWEGNIWVGTLGGGVSCYDGNEFVNYDTEYGLAHDAVLDIIEDREKSLWFACYHGGISRYNPYEISFISDEPVDEIMMRDRDGNLWWGFRNVLSRFDGKGVNHYPFEHTIFDLLEDSKGRFWVGVDGGGVYIYNSARDVCSPCEGEDVGDRKPQNLTTDDGLANNRVTRIYEDMQGHIWIGTRSGLSRYDGTEFTNFTTDNGLGSKVVSAICQDTSGTLWFAGWAGGGITAYDGETFHGYTVESGLADDSILCMMEDNKGNLWIGTSVGVSCYNEGSFRNYTTEDGLSGSFIQRMTQDSRGQIWIATLGGGISRFDGRNFQSLTMSDGLPSNSITGIIENPDGSMVLSTYRGICRYVPDFETPPLIHIDRVDADRIYDKPESIQISESLSSIRIKYHGVSFRTKRMRYSYILEGYDQDWMATWDEEIRYESLPIGEYIFKVMAISKDMVLSEKPAELKLKVVADTRDQVISELEKEVRERTKELRKHRDHLEELVQQRTEELTKVVGQLQAEIAERRRIEEALRESEEMYRTIFETTGTAAIISEEDTKISLANTEFEKLCGYTKEEIEGRKSWTEFVDENSLERMRGYHLLRRIDPGAVPKNYEAQFIKRTGDIRDCLITVSMIPGTKKSVALIVDITEHKEEAERIQSAKMESLRQLVAGVAHQMNTPIGAISSSNDISSRAIGRIKDRIAEKYCREMGEDESLVKTLAILEKVNQVGQTAATEIAEIVANLRRFVRLDEAEWQFADIHEGIDSVIALMEPELSDRIKVIRDYGHIPRIYCSPSSLNQIFMSLLKNASEAIEGKGEICLRTFAQRDQVKIIISDTGRGIPAKDIDRIFDLGFTTKGVKVGVGLGLSICYKIVVDEHKGHIHVSSEPDKGTTFTITLSKRCDR